MRETNSHLRQHIFSMALAPLLVLVGIAGSNDAWAKTFVQDPTAPGASETSGWLAFEAEDYDEIIDLDGDGVSWSVVDDVDALGGKALEADAGAGVNVGNEADAVYHVKFTIPDHYKVFGRYKNFGTDDRRSIFTSGDPNLPFPENPLRTWFTNENSGEAEVLRTLGGTASFLADGETPEFFYAFLGAAHIGDNPANQNAADIDEVLEFRLGIRTPGALLDRIIFVDSTTPGPADQTIKPDGDQGGRYHPIFQLDALPNSPVELDGDPDVDGDGDVDGADFLAIQRTDPSLIPAWEAGYGTGTLSGITAVPEPSSCLLLLAGGVMVAVRRRR